MNYLETATHILDRYMGGNSGNREGAGALSAQSELSPRSDPEATDKTDETLYLALVETSPGVWEDPAEDLPDFDRGVAPEQLSRIPVLPPRPAGVPTFGLTQGGHVVELPRTPGEERVDPTVKVTGPGWPGWYPPEARRVEKS